MAKTLILLFFGCLILSVPVAFTMGLAGLVAIYVDGSLNPLIAAQRMFAGIDSFPLMAVPFFILTSELMTACGLTTALLRFANALVGHLRGGLGHVNILVSIMFAGISGSGRSAITNQLRIVSSPKADPRIGLSSQHPHSYSTRSSTALRLY